MANKILRIKRSEWDRGPRKIKDGCPMDRYLLNPDGTKCCLGFEALAFGLDSEDIDGVPTPCGVWDLEGELDIAPPKIVDYMRGRAADPEYPYPSLNSGDVSEAINLNDSLDMSDAEREAKLVPVLKRLGWDDVVFED